MPDSVALQRAYAVEKDLTDPDVIRERLRAWHKEQEALVTWYSRRFDNVKVRAFPRVFACISRTFLSVLITLIGGNELIYSSTFVYEH